MANSKNILMRYVTMPRWLATVFLLGTAVLFAWRGPIAIYDSWKQRNWVAILVGAFMCLFALWFAYVAFCPRPDGLLLKEIDE